jgi:tetratricopeptide (TPR) repeat protein
MKIDNDDLLYEYVLEELEKIEPIKGLWAKAIAHSEGNNEKAKSLYMQYRVQVIKDEFKALELDYNSLKKEQIFSTIKNGFKFNEETKKIKIQQEEKIEEEKKVAEKQQQELLKKEDEEKYGKIKGWLIFFAVLIVLWNLSQFGFIEYFKDEYISAIQNMYLSGNEKMAKTFSYLFYSELFTAFMLFLFTLSFFTKASITRAVAIWFFIILFVVRPFQTIGLMNIFKEINEVPPLEVVKIIGSLLWAFIFLLYFIFSKRVKKTFVQKKDTTTLVVASLIIPFFLWIAYSSKNGKPSDYTLQDTAITKANSYFYTKDYTNSIEYYNIAINYGYSKYKIIDKFRESADKYFENKDYKSAIELYKIASDDFNDNSSRFRLAYSYSATEQYYKAIDYYEKYLTNNSYEGAMRNLGLVYERVNNNAKAQEWFKKAYDIYIKKGRDGDKEAAKWLALMYEYGEGIEKDYNKAQYWRTKSNE